jgi:hypothetical protein
MKTLLLLDKPIICKTIGDGYWSKRKVTLKHVKLRLDVMSFDYKLCGSLDVYFSPKDWPNTYGAIYTDTQWLKDLKKNLAQRGFSKKALKTLDYSEYGMQGNNKVNLDVDELFCIEFLRLSLD